MLIDRYLVACADAEIPALLVLNKTDLLSQNDPILQLVSEYEALGYEVMQTQSKGDLSALAQRLDGETVAFVGQSGVGKSSLINAIVPDASQKTNIISENSALGQHTTTSTRLIRFGTSGALIDSPEFVNLACGIWMQIRFSAVFLKLKICWGTVSSVTVLTHMKNIVRLERRRRMEKFCPVVWKAIYACRMRLLKLSKN